VNSTIEILNRWAEQAFSFAWPILWQSSLLIGVLFALDCLLRRRVRRAVLYALWLSVLVKLLLPPSLALPSGISYWLRPRAQAREVKRRPTLMVTYGSDNLPGLPPGSLPALPKSWKPMLSTAAWGMVVSSCTSLGLLAWMLVQWRQVTRDAQRSGAVPCWLNELIEETRYSAGVRFSVRVKITERAVSPAVCGMLHPIILLPRALVEQLTSTQMRAILLHEVIHLRRGDVWVNCLQALLQIVYWWHPLLWLANARIRHAREEAVDDAVMQKLRNDADAYAPTLLQVAKLVMQRPVTSLGLVGILESHSSLRRRIERLVDFNPPRTAGLTLGSALCILAFGALALPMGQAPATQRDIGLNPTSARAVFHAQESPAVEAEKAGAGPLVQAAQLSDQTRKVGEVAGTVKEVAKQDSADREDDNYSNVLAEKPSKGASSKDSVSSEGPSQSNFETRPNLIDNNRARLALVTKLHTLRIDRVQFDSLSLGEVVAFLNNQVRKLDPAGQGINFMISSASGNPDPGSAQSEPGEVAAVQVKILPALSDVWLADVLDAIVMVANRPIQYSIEDRCVVFAWKARGPVPLYTRLIKVNPNTFKEGLERALGASLSQPGAKRDLAREFFEAMGVYLNPPKVVFFNEGEGSLLVHATLADLVTIEAAVHVLNTPPPQVNIKVRFFEVPEALSGPIWRLLNPTNQPTDKASGLTVVLTSPQWSVLRQSMESNAQVNFLNEASVTTQTGRQFEVQVVDPKTIATNLNPRALKPPGISAGTEGVYLEEQIPFGPMLDAIATTASLSSNKWQIQLNVTASITDVSHYERTNHVRVYVDGKPKSVPFALPHFRTRKMTANAMVYDGQALVIGTQMDEPLPGTGKANINAKRLLAVITPTIIDSSGNQLHTDGKLFSK
jgi:beta-lactamase regulating signal transducer with metallopeptidase domain